MRIHLSRERNLIISFSVEKMRENVERISFNFRVNNVKLARDAREREANRKLIEFK